jgi:hypothetical protein
MSSSEFHHYTRDEFLTEFYPDPDDKAAIAAGMEQLRAEQRAFRLAEMRRRLGITQAQVAARMGITQGRPATSRRKFRADPAYPAARAAGSSRLAEILPCDARTRSATCAHTSS